jgi:hypothetical protein
MLDSTQGRVGRAPAHRDGSTASLRVGRDRLGDSLTAAPLALRVGRARLSHSESAGFDLKAPLRVGRVRLPGSLAEPRSAGPVGARHPAETWWADSGGPPPGPGPMGTWVAPARRTPAKPPCGNH